MNKRFRFQRWRFPALLLFCSLLSLCVWWNLTSQEYAKDAPTIPQSDSSPDSLVASAPISGKSGQTNTKQPLTIAPSGQHSPAAALPASQKHSVRPSLVEKYYPNTPVVFEERLLTNDPRFQKRVRVVKTDLKYPLVRIEDTLLKTASGQDVIHSVAMVADHFLVQLAQDTGQEAVLKQLETAGYSIRHSLAFSRNLMIEIPSDNAHSQFYTFISDLQERLGTGAIVEPDYLVYPSGPANDPSFQDGALWGLNNEGQNGGTPGADISAEEAWDLRSDASSVVVAVVDTGVRATHVDLNANMWVNNAEIANNGVDDDGNGVIDDVHGFDAVNHSGDPSDVDGHGTHVAGTIGALGNNGTGVTGVAWNVQLMALRFLSANGGFTSDAIESIDYARLEGASVVNNSWGGGGFSTALLNAIQRTEAADMVFVVAAGNDNSNNDSLPAYPASYNVDNIVTVASSDRNDNRSGFSNFGATSVDLAAPGSSIRSTYFSSNTSYASLSGTSMASPHVAGAAAVLRAEFPAETYSQIKNRLLDTVDPLPAFSGNTVSGGRLNLFAALRNEAVPQPGVVAFSESVATVIENTDNVAIIVNRTAGTSGTISVSYNTSNGSAVAGSDFVGQSNSLLTWSDGDNTERIINISINNDSETEGSESFTVQLSNPTGDASIGTLGLITVTILDDEFQQTQGLGIEDAIEVSSPSFFSADPSPSLAVGVNDDFAVVAMELNSQGVLQCLLQRFHANGSLDWERTYTAELGTYQPQVAMMANGNVVVAYGSIQNISGGFIQQTAISVVAFDSDGNFLWNLAIPGNSNDIDLPYAVTIGPDDSIYIGGEFNGFGSGDTYVAKVSSSGAYQWSDTLDLRPVGQVSDAVTSLDIDSQGNLYAGGWSVGANGFVGALLKYQSNGTRDYAVTYPAVEQQRVRGLTVNAFDEVYLGMRTFNNANGVFNAKLMKIAPLDGAIIWQQAESISSQFPNFLIAATPNGFVNFAEAPEDIGELTSTYSVGQYDREGVKQFENVIDASAALSLSAVAGRSDGNFLLTGAYEGLAQFGTAFFDSGGSASVFVVQLSPEDPVAPGSLEFEIDNYSVLENLGVLDITVSRKDGFDGTVSVELQTIAGEAGAGEDFTPISEKVLTFTPGQQTVVCQLNIINDFVEEPNESFQVSLSNTSGGATLGNNQNTTISILNDDFGFETWLSTYFSEEQLNDPAIVGESIDFDRDGLSNLFEYGFGLDPTIISQTPSIQILDITDETLTLRYERATGRDDLNFTIEGSSELSSWNLEAVHQTTISSIEEETEHERVDVAINNPLDANTNSGFFRIAIERTSQGIGAHATNEE